MKKIRKKIVVTVALMGFFGFSKASIAGCGCCGCECAPHLFWIQTAIVQTTAAQTSTLVSTLNSLLRDNKGYNVAQALREFQATSTKDNIALGKQLTEATDAHKAEMIAYEQRKEEYKSAKAAYEDFSDVTVEECAEYIAKLSTHIGRYEQAKYGSSASIKARTVAGSSDIQEKNVEKIYNKHKDDPRTMDAGIVTRPNCIGQYSEKETAYGDNLPVIGGYLCKDKSYTISKNDAEKASEFIASMVVPHPIPALPQKERKTNYGVKYETERNIIRQRQSYLLDVSQKHLEQLLPSRELPAAGRSFFTKMGLTKIPFKLSPMDYLRYHVIARWDNPEFMKYQAQRNDNELLQDLHESILLLTAIQFRQLEIMEERIPAEMQYFEAMQDIQSRNKLEQLRIMSNSAK